MLHFIFDLVKEALNISLFVFIIIKHICIVLVYIFIILVYIYIYIYIYIQDTLHLYRIFHKCYISYLI